MAHNLATVNGKVSFAATLEKGQKSWHGLGTYVDKAMTAEEAIKLAGLDYEVKAFPLFAHEENDNQVVGEAKRHVGLVRSDTNQVLGVVSRSYGIVQNVDCFSFLDGLVDSSEAIYETAGALGIGETIFLTAKLPNDIIVNGDKIENYFLLTNGHGNGKPLTAMLTPIRVVCNNTLNVALKNNTNKVTIRHTLSATDRVKEGARLMGLASKYTIEMQEAFDAMSHKKISDKQLLDYITKIIAPNKKDDDESKRVQNNIENVFEFAVSHDTQQTKATKGTLFGAFNAITGNFNFVKDYKSNEQKMKDVVWGGGSIQTQNAFDLALSMLN